MEVKWRFNLILWDVPSGNVLHSELERSTMLLMGKSTMSTGSCSIAILQITRGYSFPTEYILLRFSVSKALDHNVLVTYYLLTALRAHHTLGKGRPLDRLFTC